MLLTNFGALCASGLGYAPVTKGIETSTGEFPVASALCKIPTSTNINSTISTDEYTANKSYSGAGAWSFGFGDGTTPPTVDDYRFSGNLVSPSYDDGGVVSVGSNGVTWQMAVINDGDNSITINEIGLFIKASSSGCLMLTRDVLPEPVILEAGASKGFQIFIDTQSFVTNASQA